MNVFDVMRESRGGLLYSLIDPRKTDYIRKYMYMRHIYITLALCIFPFMGKICFNSACNESIGLRIKKMQSADSWQSLKLNSNNCIVWFCKINSHKLVTIIKNRTGSVKYPKKSHY